MALTLHGIDPAAKRSYHWIGDGACDLAKSALSDWRADGTGLVAFDGQHMTEFTCEALRPTTLQVVYGSAHGDVGNMAAVQRLAVAYGVTGIEHGPALRRVHGPGGLRLHDDLLNWLDTLVVDLKSGPDTIRMPLLQHLGSLILGDSEATPLEKKVCELPCTPEK